MYSKLLVVVAVLVFLCGVTFLFFFTDTFSNMSTPLCLTDEQEAASTTRVIDAYTEIVTVSVYNKKSGSKINSAEYSISPANHYHPFEIQRCHVYLLEGRGFDYKTMKVARDFSKEVRRYDYAGRGETVVLLAENKTGSGEVLFSYDFRVDPSEKYIVLLRGYSGSNDYAIVFRDIESEQTVFELPMEWITENYDGLTGDFGLGKWVEDGAYLWAEIYFGPHTFAFLRIKRDTWEVEVLRTPSNVASGGEEAATPNGLFAYTDLTVWTGIVEVDEQLMEEAEKEGRTNNLFIANLRTGEIRQLEAGSPRHRYNLEFISDAELKYTLPDGTEKVYRMEL